MERLSVLSRVLTISILSTFIPVAGAAEKLLCVVTSDVDKEVGKMVYDMDEDLRVITHFYSDKYLNDKFVERVELPIQDLNGAGIILSKKDKYVAVRMYSHNFDVSSGGMMYLDTLYNGINGQRKEYAIEVRMDGGTTPVMTYNNTPFTKMNFVAKKSGIFGVVGIERVEFSK
jgi:hypothetical protein